METRALTKELFPSAGRLLAEAFFTNPAHVYICQDDATRLRKLEWLLRANLRAQAAISARSFCLATGSTVEAMGFWTPPRSGGIGVLARFRAGFLAAPFRLTRDELRRAGEVSSRIDRQREAALPADHWYLNNMAVRAEHRGKGMGSALLSEQIERLRGRDPGALIALSTQRQENVVFYGRLGFETLLEETLGSGPHAFRSWLMVDHARGEHPVQAS